MAILCGLIQRSKRYWKHVHQFGFKMKPELRGLTWSQKDLWRRLSTQSPHRDWSWFRNVSGYSLLDRHLFTTSKSDFGLSPKGSKLNDTIAILYGGSTPSSYAKFHAPQL